MNYSYGEKFSKWVRTYFTDYWIASKLYTHFDKSEKVCHRKRKHELSTLDIPDPISTSNFILIMPNIYLVLCADGWTE